MALSKLLPGADRSVRRLITVQQMRNPYPAFLYKYRTGNEEYLDRLIVHSELYFSHRDDFNDPFDARCNTVLEGAAQERQMRFQQLIEGKKLPFKTREKIRKQFLDPERARKLSQRTAEEIADSIGLYSLAETPRSLLMWAHYAAEHKGICLQFYLPEDLSLFKGALPVVYSENFPVVNMLETTDREQAALRAFLTKSLEWKYEEEWRLFSRGQTRTSVPFAPGALVGVIYGARCTPETVLRVQTMIARREKLGRPRLYEWKAALSPRHYGVGIFTHLVGPSKRWEGRPSSRSKSVAAKSEDARPS